MVMWKFRSCPRCGGDLFLDRDVYNWYEECVQCGYIRDLKSLDEFRELSVDGEKARKVTETGESLDQAASHTAARDSNSVIVRERHITRNRKGAIT